MPHIQMHYTTSKKVLNEHCSYHCSQSNWQVSMYHPQPLWHQCHPSRVDLKTSTDKPTLTEVTRALLKLKNGRAAGLNGIPPELLKCAINPVYTVVHLPFMQVWRSGHITADWRDGILTALYKGKGRRRTTSTTGQSHCFLFLWRFLRTSY